ncbi:MAG: nucleotidyltransferase family protein [Nanoarchaeota archaeon]
MTGKDIITFLKDSKGQFDKFGVKKIGLFGSYIKDQETEGSDIDILVEFKENSKTFDNYMDLKFYLEDNLKKKVDLVIENSIKDDLKNDILGSVKYA